MATEIPQTLPLDHTQARIRIDEEDSGYDADGAGRGGAEEKTAGNVVEDVRVNSATRRGRNVSLKTKASELTLSFEGKVYVFQEVTPEKVQAVLSLLGGSEIPNGYGQCPRCLNVSRRIASLVRFREKRKDRFFDKRLRNNAYKKVEQKMDSQSIKCPLELNEAFQTGGDLPMETDSGISKDIEVEKVSIVNIQGGLL
ncbi:Tify [Macleaya cordata]|uniref:Tify n=1 Tax=Macleaya cordata TaxID=56857 RepID=A0A200PUF4_MACCD|nr:Tify [Macleaya cordata]